MNARQRLLNVSLTVLAALSAAGCADDGESVTQSGNKAETCAGDLDCADGDLQCLRYCFDRVGNVVQVADGNAEAKSQSLGYDDRYQLTSAEGHYGRIDYAYDALGRRESQSGVGNYHYEDGAHPHAVTTITGDGATRAYSYDAAGRLTSGPGQADIQWNGFDKPQRIDADGRVVRMKYDAHGNKVGRVVSGGGQPRQSTIYAGGLAELDSRGNLRKYVYAGARRVAVVEAQANTSGDSSSYGADSSSYGAASAGDDTVSYYHPDHLGSTTLMTNDSGGVVQRASYDPYGRVVASEGSRAEKMQFNGREHDDVLGMTDFGARYYAGDGFFASADSVVTDPDNPLDYNAYTYVRNSPINYTDPTGNSPEQVSLDLSAYLRDAAAQPSALGVVGDAMGDSLVIVGADVSEGFGLILDDPTNAWAYGLAAGAATLGVVEVGTGSVSRGAKAGGRLAKAGVTHGVSGLGRFMKWTGENVGNLVFGKPSRIPTGRPRVMANDGPMRNVSPETIRLMTDPNKLRHYGPGYIVYGSVNDPRVAEVLAQHASRRISGNRVIVHGSKDGRSSMVLADGSVRTVDNRAIAVDIRTHFGSCDAMLLSCHGSSKVSSIVNMLPTGSSLLTPTGRVFSDHTVDAGVTWVRAGR